MNGSTPTTQLSTIPATAKAPETPAAAPETPAEGQKGGEIAAPTPPESSSASPEAPKEPERDADLELARRFDAAAKREARARRMESDFQQKMASLAEREKAMEAKIAELDTKLGEFEEFEADPVAFAEKRGKDPVELVKRAAQPKSREALETEKRLKKLEEERREDLRRREDEAKQWEERQLAQRRESAMRKFITETKTEEYPHLTSLYEPHEVPALVRETLNRPHQDGGTLLEAFQEQHGRPPSDKEIRDFLEYEAEQRATKLEEARKRRAAAQAEQPPETVREQGEGAGAGPKTISNQHAAVGSGGKSRPLSFEEKRKKARSELTAALEAGSSRK